MNRNNSRVFIRICFILLLITLFAYYVVADTAPSVTLNLPVNTANLTSNPVTFNCSATDNEQLVNITLYGNWSSGWHANQTNNLTGTDNSTTFQLNLSNGIYVWNCLATDNTSNSSFAAANYPLNVTVDPPPPIYTKFNGSTTNFSAVENISAVGKPI